MFSGALRSVVEIPLPGVDAEGLPASHLDLDSMKPRCCSPGWKETAYCVRICCSMAAKIAGKSCSLPAT